MCRPWSDCTNVQACLALYWWQRLITFASSNIRASKPDLFYKQLDIPFYKILFFLAVSSVLFVWDFQTISTLSWWNNNTTWFLSQLRESYYHLRFNVQGQLSLRKFALAKDRTGNLSNSSLSSLTRLTACPELRILICIKG